MENLPILQNFVPYRGHCPASPHENQGESRAGQGNRWPFDAFGLLINLWILELYSVHGFQTGLQRKMVKRTNGDGLTQTGWMTIFMKTKYALHSFFL